MTQPHSLLSIHDLSVRYPRQAKRGAITAVNHVSMHAFKGEIIGLVGESGCGKTSLANAVMGILAPVSGQILFNGETLDTRNSQQMTKHRQRVQMIFQDPMGALNPRITIGSTLDEVLWVHRRKIGLATPMERSKRRDELLRQVGLVPASFRKRYPHELSGGQRQRIGIARALAVEPEILIADEPVSALDVSVQVQILNLIKDLCQELSVACLLIAHDLAVIHYMCQRTYVMFRGEIVEEGNSNHLFKHPSHPYTCQLIEAVPDIRKGLQRRQRQTR